MVSCALSTGDLVQYTSRSAKYQYLKWSICGSNQQVKAFIDRVKHSRQSNEFSTSHSLQSFWSPMCVGVHVQPHQLQHIVCSKMSKHLWRKEKKSNQPHTAGLMMLVIFVMFAYAHSTRLATAKGKKKKKYRKQSVHQIYSSGRWFLGSFVSRCCGDARLIFYSVFRFFFGPHPHLVWILKRSQHTSIHIFSKLRNTHNASLNRIDFSFRIFYFSDFDQRWRKK